MEQLFKNILPPGIASVETRKHLKWTALLPEELPAVRRACSKRRAEFISGRACAREALSQIGFEGIPIPKGINGVPIWPCQVIGSITHCSGFRAVAVTRKQVFQSLGIDVEVNEPLPPDVIGAIASRPERIQSNLLQLGTTSVAFDRLLFSAKESAFKCFVGAGIEVADFASIRVRLGPNLFAAGTGAGELSHRANGYWLARHGFICSAATICIGAENPELKF